MGLKYPQLRPGDALLLLNSDYFTHQPRWVGQEAHFVRYATDEELARGAGPYVIQLPNGHNFAALETEIAPSEKEDAGAVTLDVTDW